jgi:DNA primase
MSDLQQIRNKLRDEDNVERLLEALGCEHIKPEQRGFMVTAQLPDRFHSTNKRSVQVKLNNSLSCQIRNRGDFKGGSIFDLVSYIEYDKRGDDEFKHNLHKSKEFICKVFGWTHFLKAQKGDVFVKDYTASLKEIINGKERKKEVRPNPVLPEEVMLEYYPYGKPLPYQDWIDEGISYKTQKMYGVGFCLESKRIVFPLRNRFGQLVGVKGRIVKDEDDLERKYLYLYRCNNRYEWFNWHYAHPYILMEKKVYILESEKSPMKLFDKGVYNALAIGASDISIEQADMVKQLGLDIEIVLCYDKGITIDEIKRNAEMFKGRKVSAMFDTDNILENKNSPIDQGIEVWNEMVEKYTFPINV